MRSKILALFLLAGGSLFAGTHVSVGIGIGAPGPVYGYAAPPPARAYVAPRYVRPGYSWVGGYWYPQGGRYAWRDGYWGRPPYRHAYWVGPRYYRHGYYPGYWRR